MPEHLPYSAIEQIEKAFRFAERFGKQVMFVGVIEEVEAGLLCYAE